MENEEKENKKNHLESCMYSFISLTSPPLLALLLLLNATEKIEIVTIRMAMRSDINYHTSPSPSSLLVLLIVRYKELILLNKYKYIKSVYMAR